MRYRLKTEEELIAEGWTRNPSRESDVLYGPPGMEHWGINDEMRIRPLCSKYFPRSGQLFISFEAPVEPGGRRWYWHPSMFKKVEE